jgi:hypothetical protein
MPVNIEAALHRFQNPVPTRHQDSPHQCWIPPNYGATIQLAPLDDDSLALDPDGIPKSNKSLAHCFTMLMLWMPQCSLHWVHRPQRNPMALKPLPRHLPIFLTMLPLIQMQSFGIVPAAWYYTFTAMRPTYLNEKLAAVLVVTSSSVTCLPTQPYHQPMQSPTMALPTL